MFEYKNDITLNTLFNDYMLNHQFKIKNNVNIDNLSCLHKKTDDRYSIIHNNMDIINQIKKYYLNHQLNDIFSISNCNINLLDLYLFHNDNDIICLLLATFGKLHNRKLKETTNNIFEMKENIDLSYSHMSTEECWAYDIIYNINYIQHGIDINDIMNSMLIINC